MREELRALLGTMRKELATWRRDRPVLAVGVLAPVVMLVIMSLFFGAGGHGDALPVVLIQEERSPGADRLAELFGTLRSQVSPWWKLLPADSAIFHRQEVPAMVVLPAGFDDRGEVLIYLHNFNSDMDQNLRYRLAFTLMAYENSFPQNHGVQVQRIERMNRDVTWVEYMAAGILAYAPMLAGILYGAVAASREFDRNTARVLALAPRHRWGVGLGKALAAAVGASVAAGVAVAAVVFFWGLRVAGSPPLLAAVLLLQSLAFAGVGVALGAVVRRQHLLMLPAGLIAIPLWFLSGGIGPVALFPIPLQAVARWLPTTYAFHAVSLIVLAGGRIGIGADLAVLGAAAAIGLGTGAVVLARRVDQWSGLTS